MPPKPYTQSEVYKQRQRALRRKANGERPVIGDHFSVGIHNAMQSIVNRIIERDSRPPIGYDSRSDTTMNPPENGPEDARTSGDSSNEADKARSSKTQ